MKPIKKVLSLFIGAAMLFSLLPAGGPSAHAAEPSSGAVTMAAFGQRLRMPELHTSGDTWDSAWRANDEVYLQMNDGTGFHNDGFMHDMIMKLNGSPDDPASLSGENLNPGSLGNLFGNTYSTGIYEVDGVLYHIICYSDQVPGAWLFHRSSILKSTDGGANWTNHNGQTNVIPGGGVNECMFPEDQLSDFNFVKYGKGGVAPNIDNAQTYVYLITPSSCWGSDYYLARVKRADLPLLDKTKYSYYQGGDGMLDTSWSDSTSDAQSLYHDSDPVPKCGPSNVVYNPELGRYMMISQYSDSWANPKVESTFFVYEAPHPWGPWTRVLEENLNYKEKANLTWPYLMQKFISGDGRKMWLTTCGEAAQNSPWGSEEYFLQFKELYLTTEPVHSYQAENASLNGADAASSKAGYTGTGYVTGFDAAGDSCRFRISAPDTGAYILKFRYNTSGHQTASLFVNGQFKETLMLGKTEQYYADWSEYTVFAWLNRGDNTITFQKRQNDSGNFNLDSLSYALYSTEENSLPGCGTVTYPYTVNDKDLVYSGTWVYDNSSSRSSNYQGDIHWTAQNGAYAEYTFTGTGVQYISDRADDLGEVEIYIDNMATPAATVNAYAAARKYQEVLFSADDLGDGPHTIRIVKKNGGYASLDAVKITNEASEEPGPADRKLINDSLLNYRLNWIYDNGASRAGNYAGDVHWTAQNGAYVDYTFTGTGIQYLSDKASDMGNVEIYIDNMASPAATVNAYAPSRQYQQVLYENLALGEGSHTIRIMKKDGAYASIDALAVIGAPEGPAQKVSWVKSASAGGTLRNDYTDDMGVKILVGNASVTVTDLGRWYVNGNNGTHYLKLTDAATGHEIAGVNVNMLSEKDSQGFVCASLNEPVILNANTYYYLSSGETNGGDYWHNDVNTTVQTSSEVTVAGSVWHSPGEWNDANPGTLYGPLTMKYYVN